MASIVAGVAERILDGVVRLTAPNPGVMTGPGTNGYLVGTDELILVDPGPEIASHAEALAKAAGGRLKWIVCTHTHQDHSPASRAVKAATGASVAGMAAPSAGRQDEAFRPDRVLAHGDTVSVKGVTLTAIHTPGHASNHLCYLLEGQRLLFTGDHVMQGSTVVISPPDGSMSTYLRSLESLLQLDLEYFAPGHGTLIPAPHDEVRRLVAHRLKREAKVVAGFAAGNPTTIEQLVKVVYDDVPVSIHPAAMRSLHAHLLKLIDDGRAEVAGDEWRLLR
jgi:glyoxylase-like metal-dependent hydrolase (beta-lactamase superfamily II)